jgi:hypothetical protein
MHMPFWSADVNLQPSFEVSISIILHLFNAQLNLGYSQISSISTSGSRVMYVYVLFNSAKFQYSVYFKSHFSWLREIFRTRFKYTSVCLLDPCRIYLRKELTDSSIRRTFLLGLQRVSDIRASHLQNQTLVLGNHIYF